MTTPDLRLGRWEVALADVEVDAVVTDPPYSERTHSGHARVLRHKPGEGLTLLPDGASRSDLPYSHWDSRDVEAFVAHWSPRCRGWFVALTSHDLWRAYEAALLDAGRYVFHPIPCVIRGMTLRICGDGPSSWAVWAVVARPANREFSSWGTLPGAYGMGRGERAGSKAGAGVTGGKPLALMRALIRDYTRPGDLVCDPCAGAGTTLLAAAIEGRRAIGAEVDPATYEIAARRLARGYTPDLFAEAAP